MSFCFINVETAKLLYNWLWTLLATKINGQTISAPEFDFNFWIYVELTKLKPLILIKMALSSVVAIAPAFDCEIVCNNNKYLSYLLNISPSKVLKFIFVHVNVECVLFPTP